MKSETNQPRLSKYLLAALLCLLLAAGVGLVLFFFPLGPTDAPAGSAVESESSEESAESRFEESEPVEESAEESQEESFGPPVRVSKRADRSEAMTYHDFYQAGLLCEVVYEPSEEWAYGQVIRVEYTGTEDETGYLVQPEKPVILHVSTAQGGELSQYNDRILYLTFDDGPRPTTSELADILDAYNVKATFFTVGAFCEYYPQQIERLYQSGQALGCHSYSHRYRDIYGCADDLEQDIHRWEASIQAAVPTPLPYHLYRFPGGSTNRAIDKTVFPLLQQRLEALGYRSYDWSCANCDKWKGAQAEGQSDRDYYETQAIQTVASIERAHPERPRIMLLHETVADTRDMVPWLIEYFSAKGYTFRSLDRLDQSYWF